MDNNSVDQMAVKFNSIEELRAYSASQYNTIVKLSKEINEKNEEIKHLQKLVADNTPIFTPGSTNPLLCLKDLSDSEAIAFNELRKLKDTSLIQQLTYEEAKKAELYTKILSGLNKKDPVKPEKELTTANLLYLLKNTDDNG